ncbi:MAG: hypothetical protein QOK05_1564 [Chloroflexota bacterium]|jgi:hypothetical protein|nr:hypothetical protein [Chloroflexota bacterium]
MSVSCSRIDTGLPSETAVQGHVLQGATPAEHAYVRVARPDGEYVSEVRCGPSGTFYIPLLPGEWSVICYAPHGYRAEQGLKVMRGDHFDIEFRLDDAA